MSGLNADGETATTNASPHLRSIFPLDRLPVDGRFIRLFNELSATHLLVHRIKSLAGGCHTFTQDDIINVGALGIIHCRIGPKNYRNPYLGVTTQVT